MAKSKLLGLVLVVTILVTAFGAGCSSSTPVPTATVAPTATAVGTATAKPTGTAVATATNPPAGQVTEIKFSVQHPPVSVMVNPVDYAWMRYVNLASNGRLKITLYHSSSAAAPPDQYDAARTGIVDMSCQSGGYVKGRFPLYEVGSLPLMFRFPGSQAASYTMQKLMAKYPEMQAQFKEVHYLGAHANGPSHVHTINKPVKTAADLKGLIINASGDQATAIKLIGATPESLLPTEAYDALAKRVLDGNLLEWEGENIWKYIEQVNYSTEVGLALSPFVHSMNLNTWNKLPPDLQVFFNEKNQFEFGEVQGYLFDIQDAAWKESMQKVYASRGKPPIYVLPKEERDRWVAAVMPMRTDWVTKNAAKGPTQAILNDAMKFEEEFRTLDISWAGKLINSWGATGSGLNWTVAK